MYMFIYIYPYIYIYIYICVFIYTNLPRNVNRLIYPWSEDSQGQKTF